METAMILATVDVSDFGDHIPSLVLVRRHISFSGEPSFVCCGFPSWASPLIYLLRLGSMFLTFLLMERSARNLFRSSSRSFFPLYPLPFDLL